MTFFTQELAIDLGTANTVIFQDGAIVLDEPSVVAVDAQKGDLVAVGDIAVDLHDIAVALLVADLDLAAGDGLASAAHLGNPSFLRQLRLGRHG